jgi:cobalt-zinc-cadmium efflux system outer membrane protein
MLLLPLAVHAQSGNRGAPPASASTYIDPSAGLTVRAAVAQALEREPLLRAGRTKIDAATGMKLQAERRPNPSLVFAQQEEPAGTDNQTRIEVQWPLDLFRKAGRVAVANREIDAVRYATADRERSLAAEVRIAYGETAAAVRTLSVTEDVLAATARQQALVSGRVDQGAAPPLERDMLRVEALRLESDRLLQAGDVERRLIELKRLLGMPPESSLKLADSLEQLDRLEAPAGQATADQTSVEQRPDVREAESRVSVADAQIDRAEREGRTDVSLFGMYMRTDAGFPQRGFTDTGELARVHGIFHYVAGGATVTLPFLNRNQGTLAAAQADRAGAALELEAARLRARAERTRDGYARRAFEAYGTDAVPLATRNLETVRQTYELGRATLLDVVAEQRRYLDLQRAYTDVLHEAYQARQALKQALGDTR